MARKVAVDKSLFLAGIGLTLFGLGIFLGRISRGNLLLYGAKTVVAGALSMGIAFLLGA